MTAMGRGKLRVGLFGFGRTGQWVARELLEAEDVDLRWVVRRTDDRAGEFVSRIYGKDFDAGPITPRSAITPTFFRRHRVDLIIDFSASETVRLYRSAASLGARVVSAVSKYEPDDLARLRALAGRTAVLYSPNISIGINLLLMSALLMRHVVPEADIAIVEEHFRQKPETSGTALKIAARLGVDPTDVVKSIRAGGIVGRHEVIFGLPNQTLRLVHESINRAAFGRGALMAGRWVMGLGPGFYTMEEMLLRRYASAIATLQERGS